MPVAPWRQGIISELRMWAFGHYQERRKILLSDRKDGFEICMWRSCKASWIKTLGSNDACGDFSAK